MKKSILPLPTRLKYLLFLIPVIIFTACDTNTNSNSIPMTNMQVLYEQDAVLRSPLEKKPWGEIYCPQQIDLHDLSHDKCNCLSMQNHGWKDISRLSDIKYQGLPYRYVNYYWIKGIFKITEDPSQYYGLFLKYIQGRDIIYINNKLVGIKPVESYQDMNRPSKYRVPSGILVKGDNAVYMRLELINSKQGGVSPELLLQTKDDYEQITFREWFKYVIANKTISISIICALFIFIIFQAYLDKTKKIYLTTALFLLYYILFAIILISPLRLLNIHLFYIYLLTSPFVLAVFFILFFQVFTGIFISFINRFIIPLILLLIVFYSIALVKMSETGVAVIALLTVVMCAIVLLSELFILYRRSSDVKKISIFVSIAIIFLAGTTVDALSYTAVLPFIPNHLSDKLYFFYMFFFAIYGIVFSTSEAKKNRIHFNKLYNKFLEHRGNESHVITITDSSEKKLDYIIEFINANYTEDLSREGLASAIDMNPNYFSSIFNKYTGRKIQEYINMLRIQKAVEMMRNSNVTIVDIAFSVGYVNISTFIRYFKKEMGTTPKEFRREIA